MNIYGANAIYINGIPLEDACRRWFKALHQLYARNVVQTHSAGQVGLKPDAVKPQTVKTLAETMEPETIEVTSSCGRITAKPIVAKLSSPFFHSSAMDGYAVRFADTFGASETTPLRLIEGKDAFYVNTGDPLPLGFTAVVMVEDVNLLSVGKEHYVEIIKGATPYQHVRVIGEDIVATELILPENHRVRAVDIGALLASGYTKVNVRRRPRVAIIPTGSELIEPGTPLSYGHIIESNSWMLSQMVEDSGASAVRLPIVEDDFEKIKSAVLGAVSSNDAVMIIAGSSAGTKDYTARVISELGEVIVHGVNIKPGRPLLLGAISDKPVIGIPGYPVSAYITYNLFVEPLIQKLLGLEAGSSLPNEASVPPMRQHSGQLRVKATLSRPINSTIGQEEFIRVKVGMVGDTMVATPLGRGAGIMMSLVSADGMLRVPAMSEGLGARAEVEIELMRPLEDVYNTIVCIGSHDNTLDVIFNQLKKRYPGYSLSSAMVGSMGGIMAIKKGIAHVAGTHLLHEETGLYNVPFIDQLLKGMKIVLINLVYREQGLIVKKGNPKNIKDIDDLVRDDVTFVNRQDGTGTRLLTNKCLRDKGLSPAMVKGFFDMVEFTHMGVASAVSSGMADTGMGILSASLALGLDFIPVTKERYDLLMTRESYELPIMKALLDIIGNDAEFREIVTSLGGYDLSDMGKVLYET
ncbi:MAG: molybdopterin biosynthesis protein [Nitrospirae bacterium]|nr:molybdopterin biosynthesis protein [Nitrospirota bacterium]